jgi:hypothetical protein
MCSRYVIETSSLHFFMLHHWDSYVSFKLIFIYIYFETLFVLFHIFYLFFFWPCFYFRNLVTVFGTQIHILYDCGYVCQIRYYTNVCKNCKSCHPYSVPSKSLKIQREGTQTPYSIVLTTLCMNVCIILKSRFPGVKEEEQ